MDLINAAPATALLILANVLASLYAFSNRGFLEDGTFIVGAVKSGQLQRLLTSGFLHVGSWHLLANMVTLFFFGPYVEQALGTGGFLLVYFASLLGGNGWALVENWRKPNYAAIGASGATSGVVISFCLFEPFAMLLIFIIPMPAIAFAIVYIVGSAYLSTRANTRIGHEAHLGGALTGAVATLIVEPGAWRSFIDAMTAALGG
ncbi:MAG: rhomboid family intramembrane serine protease [Pseudomonadota bacterium]